LDESTRFGYSATDRAREGEEKPKSQRRVKPVSALERGEILDLVIMLDAIGSDGVAGALVWEPTARFYRDRLLGLRGPLAASKKAS
jgi:hypothetical protein